MAKVDIRTETVAKLSLEKGDVVHVKLGMDLADGQGPWIPGPSEIAACWEDWAAVVPPGVQVIVTHFGQELQIVEKPNG